MIQFKGFETKAEAESFIKSNGGILTTRVLTPTGREPASYHDYKLAVICGGLNEDKYPYCVQWSER